MKKDTYGDFCEKSAPVNTDPCQAKPCYNGGVCETLDSGSYKCNCNPPFGNTGCKQNMMGSCFASRCQRESLCVPIGTNGSCFNGRN